MKKRKNGDCKVGNFGIFFFGMGADVPAFKARVFAGDLEF